MTYTLVGDELFQDAGTTDLNLSGLSAVSGVQTFNVEDKTIYYIGAVTFRIQGNQTIDPEIEELWITDNSSRDQLIVTEGSGHLTVGKEIILNGFTNYSDGLAIYLGNVSTSFDHRFDVTGSASFTWNGGVISQSSGTFRFRDNAVVRINSTKSQLLFRQRSSQSQVSVQSPNVVINGFSMTGGDITIVDENATINNYLPTQAVGA